MQTKHSFPLQTYSVFNEFAFAIPSVEKYYKILVNSIGNYCKAYQKLQSVCKGYKDVEKKMANVSLTINKQIYEAF